MVVFRPGGERVHHLPLIHIINVGPRTASGLMCGLRCTTGSALPRRSLSQERRPLRPWHNGIACRRRGTKVRVFAVPAIAVGKQLIVQFPASGTPKKFRISRTTSASLLIYT